MDNFKTIFEDFEKHLLEDEKPSNYFTKIFAEKELANKYPFSLLQDLKKVEQCTKHHPEGNVWNHTMLVVDEAASKKNQSNDPKMFMWSALLHDLGKIPATKVRKGRITAYDHDKLGENLAKDFLTKLEASDELIYKVSKMVRWHMQILYVVKDLPYADIKKMLSETELENIALLSLCDRLGRGKVLPDKKLEEEKNVEIFLEKCRNFTP